MNALPTKTSLISIDTILEQGDIEEGAMVADLGCGRSIFFLYALSKLVGKNGLVYGVDILDDVIESLRRDINHHQLTGITPVKANLEAATPTVPEKSLTAVFLINTLSQSTDSLAMMRHAVSLLAPKGKLVIVDWNNSPSPLGPALERRLEAERVDDMIELLGLSALDRFEAGPYHYGITITN